MLFQNFIASIQLYDLKFMFYETELNFCCFSTTFKKEINKKCLKN